MRVEAAWPCISTAQLVPLVYMTSKFVVSGIVFLLVKIDLSVFVAAGIF
jgi:hypothetical protein